MKVVSVLLLLGASVNAVHLRERAGKVPDSHSLGGDMDWGKLDSLTNEVKSALSKEEATMMSEANKVPKEHKAPTAAECAKHKKDMDACVSKACFWEWDEKASDYDCLDSIAHLTDAHGGPGGTCYCDDSCASGKNGICDDGAVGSKFSTCMPGTDCSDCGPSTRAALKPLTKCAAGTESKYSPFKPMPGLPKMENIPTLPTVSEVFLPKGQDQPKSDHELTPVPLPTGHTLPTESFSISHSFTETVSIVVDLDAEKAAKKAAADAALTEAALKKHEAELKAAQDKANAKLAALKAGVDKSQTPKKVDQHAQLSPEAIALSKAQA